MLKRGFHISIVITLFNLTFSHSSWFDFYWRPFSRFNILIATIQYINNKLNFFFIQSRNSTFQHQIVELTTTFNFIYKSDVVIFFFFSFQTNISYFQHSNYFRVLSQAKNNDELVSTLLILYTALKRRGIVIRNGKLVWKVVWIEYYLRLNLSSQRY